MLTRRATAAGTQKSRFDDVGETTIGELAVGDYEGDGNLGVRRHTSSSSRRSRSRSGDSDDITIVVVVFRLARVDVEDDDRRRRSAATDAEATTSDEIERRAETRVVRALPLDRVASRLTIDDS